MDLVRVDVPYVLLYDEEMDKVLMVHNEKHWSLPGGMREYGEMLNEAAVREAKEETGLDVVVKDIVHIHEKVFPSRNHVLFVTFRGEIIGGELGTTDSEIQRIEWKSIEEANELMPYYGDIRELLKKSADYVVGA